MASKTIALLVTGQGLLVIALSVFSGFHIRNPENAMNFAIATMLTPLGLIQNFLFRQNPVLMPFYWNVSGRTGILDSPLCALLVVLIPIFSILLLVRLRAR